MGSTTTENPSRHEGILDEMDLEPLLVKAINTEEGMGWDLNYA